MLRRCGERDARAWLAEKVGEHNYTREETDRRLDEFIKHNHRRDAERSEGEAGEE